LRRELGLRQAVAVGIGGTVGGGIFVLVGVASGKAGPAALIAFSLAFIAALCIALPYAELACRLPMAGGGYAFVKLVFGRHVGFVMGWTYWGAYVFLSGYVTIGFGGYLHAITGFPVRAGAIALVAACTVVNLLGMKASSSTLTMVLTTAIVGLTGFVVWGMPHVRLSNLAPFVPHGIGGIFGAALVAFLSFGGFDMIAAAGEEIKRPERTLPLAILLTLVCVLALYLAVTFVALGTVSSARLGSSVSPLADAASVFGGTSARYLVAFCALLTTAATANAVLVVISRTVFAMARDRLLPAPLALLRGRTDTPRRAVLLAGLLTGIMALTGSVSVSSSTGGFLYVLHFLLPLIALMWLRREKSRPRSAFTTPIPWLLVPVAFAGCVCLLIASGGTGSVIGTIWIALGAVAYLASMGHARQPWRGGRPAAMAARWAHLHGSDL
jgi:APA family basic amino acid/polyamine antiporter